MLLDHTKPDLVFPTSFGYRVFVSTVEPIFTVAVLTAGSLMQTTLFVWLAASPALVTPFLFKTILTGTSLPLATVGPFCKSGIK